MLCSGIETLNHLTWYFVTTIALILSGAWTVGPFSLELSHCPLVSKFITWAWEISLSYWTSNGSNPISREKTLHRENNKQLHRLRGVPGSKLLQPKEYGQTGSWTQAFWILYIPGALPTELPNLHSWRSVHHLCCQKQNLQHVFCNPMNKMIGWIFMSTCKLIFISQNTFLSQLLQKWLVTYLFQTDLSLATSLECSGYDTDWFLHSMV